MKRRTDRTVTLLGPQRHPTVVDVFDRLGLDGPVAAVTAGWQEREEEIDELSEHLHRQVLNLRLYRRSEEVGAEDPELFRAHRQRQDRLRALQRFYRYRLDFALEPARELLQREGPADLLAAAQRSAIDALRALDDEHLEAIHGIHDDFEDRHDPMNRPAVARHREQLREILAACGAVAIAGGHVAVLLNRMRNFGLADLIEDLPVVAWSAGAMAISERVVLFHDSPPQGMGNPEVLDAGLGLAPGVVPMPHARRRLRLEDPHRVAILARRFDPAICLPFDEGSREVTWDGRRWTWPAGCRQLAADGRVVHAEATA